jgi:hypothetical protein
MNDERTSLQWGSGTDRTEARSARERTDHAPSMGSATVPDVVRAALLGE